MTRLGSRQDPVLGALLAGHAAGAFDLPPGMAENRERLVSLQAVVAAQHAPAAEQTARAAAVLALTADPATDVVAAVLDARAADAEHQMRVDLLLEALEHAHDQADVLPDGWGAVLQAAHARCTAQLRTAFCTFSRVSVDPNDLWAASPQVRGAWTSFTRAALHYEMILAVHRLVRAASPAERDLEGLFFEISNMDEVWRERVEGLRPVSVMVQPWPPRSDPLGWLIWAHRAGAELYLPSREAQDGQWDRVFGARVREFAAGARHVTEMRQVFGG